MPFPKFYCKLFFSRFFLVTYCVLMFPSSWCEIFSDGGISSALAWWFSHTQKGGEWSIALCPRFVNASGFRSVCSFNGNLLPSFPLFVTLSYETEAWSAIRAISLDVVAPPRLSSPSTYFDWDKYLYKFRCRAVCPNSINYWRFIVRVEHSLGRLVFLSVSTLSLSALLLFYSYVHREHFYVYIPVYIQICSLHTNSFYWKLFDERTSAF